VNPIRTGRYTQVRIPNGPVVALCDNCGADRPFRLFTQYQFTHLGYVFRWDYEEKHFRACVECGRGQALNDREWKQFFPLYEELAPKYRRRLIFALIWVPIIAYVIYWNVNKYWLT
jgi:hypothetical protein